MHSKSWNEDYHGAEPNSEEKRPTVFIEIFEDEWKLWEEYYSTEQAIDEAHGLIANGFRVKVSNENGVFFQK